nr:hypothetical protein [uncultured Enterobacter sp.]
MYQVDLIKILKEALVYLGCDPSIIDDIDHHSTVELTFDDAPNLLLSFVDGNVVLWSQITPVDANLLVQCAPQFIEELVAEREWSSSGQVQLISGPEWFELRAVVDEEFIQTGEQFGLALESFFGVVQHFYKAMK